MKAKKTINPEVEIEKFLNKAVLRRMELTRKDGGDLILDMVNDHLIFISPNKLYLYEIAYVENFNGYNLGGDRYLMDNYVVVAKEIVSRTFNAERFWELLQTTRKKIVPRGYRIYVGGRLYQEDISYKKAFSLFKRLRVSTAQQIILENPSGGRTIYN